MVFQATHKADNQLMRSLSCQHFLTFNRLRSGLAVGSILGLLVGTMLALSALVFSTTVLAQQAATLEVRAKAQAGKAVVLNPIKGNCLACHGFPSMHEAEQTGNSGPPIIAMQSRFPDKAELRAKLWDATTSNPETMMPPFGKHLVLTETEIDQVLEFIYGL